MINLGKQEFYIKLTIDGESYDPFSASTLPPFSFWLVLAAYAALIYLASSPACRQTGNAFQQRSS